jgi:deoxyribonuclease-4
MKKHRLLLGAHMSVSGGYEKAIERAESIGCTAMQIFTKSNRQWQAKSIAPEEANLFRAANKKSSVAITITHATYLINLGSADAVTREISIKALIDELERCALLDIPYLVLHPGSFTQSDLETGLKHIAHGLDIALKQAKNETLILLEIMAGQGSTTCYTFEQLAYLLKKSSHKKRLGICFDTCHAFAAGYDFRTPETYKVMWKKFDSIIGLEHLKAMHLNDSKKELGSKVDRHEEIGEGKIGIEAFELIMNDPHLFDIPKILETPKDDLEDYAKNMALLKSLITKENKKKLGLE